MRLVRLNHPVDMIDLESMLGNYGFRLNRAHRKDRQIMLIYEYDKLEVALEQRKELLDPFVGDPEKAKEKKAGGKAWCVEISLNDAVPATSELNQGVPRHIFIWCYRPVEPSIATPSLDLNGGRFVLNTLVKEGEDKEVSDPLHNCDIRSVGMVRVAFDNLPDHMMALVPQWIQERRRHKAVAR